MMSSQSYIKHFYWVDADRIDMIRNAVMSQLNLHSIPRAKLRPCEALNHAFPAMHVPPEVWNATCYRQASWFRKSCLKDRHLIVTNEKTSITNAVLSGVITKITHPFGPIATRAQYLPLLETSEFKRSAPAEWFHLLDREIPLFKAFLERIGAHIDLDEFMERHSANHAQFLQPPDKVILTIEHNAERIPCSLFPPTFICSACMELFGVIGSQLPIKAVKNCPGLKYAPLGTEEYFLVDLQRNKE